MNNIKGLSPEEIDVLTTNLEQFSVIKKVVIFGSRAMGNFKKYSDVDLAIFGDVDLEFIGHLKYVLEEETNLPYFFDIIDYSSIDSQKLKEHIDEVGIIIFQK